MRPILLPGLLLLGTIAATAQTAPDRILAGDARERAAEMAMLHIPALRPCDTPYLPGTPQRAAAVGCRMVNFDEDKANPYPLPDPLLAADGTRVTTPAQWQARRAALKEIFDREVFGRVPAHTPAVTWRVDDTVHEMFGAVPVTTRHLTGHVDNRRDPAIAVEIKVSLSVPDASLGRHVPAIVAFTYPPRVPAPPPDPAPDFREQIAMRGWALAQYVNTSVQADNGAGLRAGIIGLMNKGGIRKPDDWGALAAWGWGASRVLDYLQTDPDIDARRVAVFGHSRAGKAALVTMVNDPRFAIGYISSSGAGGAVPYRRNFGESIANTENVTFFHWMAPNFLKYAAVGKTGNDVPVETNELIALVAPRPLFLGGGTSLPAPVNGTAAGDLWIDPVGSFKAEAGASPVYELLGARGTGTDVAPEPLQEVSTGDLAFRRHDQGHTPVPNWPYFLSFAARYFKS